MKNGKYYDTKVDFYNIHKINQFGNPLILQLVNKGSTVYDIGCNTGSLGKGLKYYKGCTVYGVDISPKAVKLASKSLKAVKQLDLENFTNIPFSKVDFDYVVLADVLEHVRNPEEVLIEIKRQLKFKYLVISLPNIAFFKNRLTHMFGKFNYTDYGIMDESHLHFYTLKTSRELFKKCGYEVVIFKPFPLTNKKLALITHPLTALYPTLFARQFVFVLETHTS